MEDIHWKQNSFQLLWQPNEFPFLDVESTYMCSLEVFHLWGMFPGTTKESQEQSKVLADFLFLMLL